MATMKAGPRPVRPISGGGGVYVDDPSGAIGKKRKVPAYPIPLNHDLDDHREYTHPDDFEDPDDDIPNGSNRPPWNYKPNYRLFQSSAARACNWNRALFLRRKAAFFTLYLEAQNVVHDAQTAILNGKLKPNSNVGDATTNNGLTGAGAGSLAKRLPEVSWFEKLVPALENLGLDDWPMDSPSWRSGIIEDVPPKNPKIGAWMSGFEKRKRMRLEIKPVARGGWAPEGSFEFESECKTSVAMRNRARNRVALAKLAVELRAMVNIAHKVPKSMTDNGSDDGNAPSKNKRKLDEKPKIKERPNNIPDGGKPEDKAINKTDGNKPAQENVDPRTAGGELSKTTSSQSSDQANGKKKKGKKKRSVLANQSNPHHVDNYRPGRIVTTPQDPLAPYPHHASLLFPPPMRFLAARPKGKDGNPTPPVRAGEDDYLCSFCEYALFFGSEALRKKAVRQRRKELKKKMEIKARAKNVAEGNGKGKLGREDDDEDEYSDEEDDGCGDGEGGCNGRCKCGRPLSGSQTKKPPDTDTKDNPPVDAPKPITI